MADSPVDQRGNWETRGMEVYFVLGLMAALVVAVIFIFNGLVRRRQMTNNGWSDIDVQLKRRADLIPQLVTTVQGYAAHERDLFADITEKRTAAISAGDNPKARGAAEGALTAPVIRLLAVAEDYPDLKASDNFLKLQTELSETESKIEMARRFYNGAVRDLNTSVQSFPANLIAGLFGFHQREFFEADMADRALPSVDLGPST